MKIHNTITQAEKFLEEATLIGTWESWYKNYYLIYKQVFDYKLNNLYMADISLYKQLVSQLDLNEWKNIINTFKKGNYESNITKLINVVKDDLSFHQNFEVYLIIGFGHVSGTAGLIESPFCYFGIESIINGISIDNIIPHEMNHMIRNSMITRYESLKDIKFEDLLISEGLGTIYPLILSGEFTEKDIANSVLNNESKYKFMKKINDNLVSEALELLDNEVTPEIFKNYFRLDNSEVKNYLGKGYYVGSKIILNLIDFGEDVRELTFIDSKSIIEKYVSQLNIV